MNICRERHVTSVNVERSVCEAAALVCRLKRLTVMSAAHYLVTCNLYNVHHAIACDICSDGQLFFG